MSREARLKKTYKSGSGDAGLSYVLYNKPPILKSSPVCRVQGEIEKVRNKIEEVLTEYPLFQKDLDYLLEWLDRNLFSLATFCYMKGDSKNHSLPDSLLEFLDNRTRELKSELEDCQDFLKQSSSKLVKLDGVRIEVRQLESAYVDWWYTSEITSFLMEKEELIGEVQHNAAILNRLSAYLFEATRKEAKLMIEAGLYVEQKTWQAELEEFNSYYN